MIKELQLTLESSADFWAVWSFFRQYGASSGSVEFKKEKASERKPFF